MGMPSINISFTEVASSVIKRGERGIIAMILKEDTVPDVNPAIVRSESDIASSWDDDSKEQISLALKGYVNKPNMIIVYFISSSSSSLATSYTTALDYFKTVKFDYLVIPSVSTDSKTSDIVTYVSSERSNGKLIKAVLPNTVGNSEGIINFATTNVFVDDTSYTTEKYCSRIAGIIAGTPLDMSCTYAPLDELTDCTRVTKSDMDSYVDGGKLIVWFDGEKVKIARGINSLTTTTSQKGNQFKKIKIVEIMDMIQNDITMTCQDDYIGKFANTYDNKCLLLSAIGNYFDVLIGENVISSYSVEIDVDANRSYLASNGINVSAMSEFEIKSANTGSNVFLKASIKILDSVEDITLPISI